MSIRTSGGKANQRQSQSRHFPDYDCQSTWLTVPSKFLLHGLSLVEMLAVYEAPALQDCTGGSWTLTHGSACAIEASDFPLAAPSPGDVTERAGKICQPCCCQLSDPRSDQRSGNSITALDTPTDRDISHPVQAASCHQIRAPGSQPNSMAATNGSPQTCLRSSLADRPA